MLILSQRAASVLNFGEFVPQRRAALMLTRGVDRWRKKNARGGFARRRLAETIRFSARHVVVVRKKSRDVPEILEHADFRSQGGCSGGREGETAAA